MAGPKIKNWTTPEKLAAMEKKGWKVVKRTEAPYENRTIIELRHPEKKVVTYRSLPL